MQSLSQIGNARREERVLLPSLIELRSEQGDEALTADGLDVSPSGVSVRAAFVPEVGTRLMLSFRCPPNDDAVRALGEVMWSTWDGPRIGSFGMRFLELDTKSATAIRRYVAPDGVSVEEAPPPRPAVMHIDGLGAPIEADVRLYDQACIVLEQELSFLRLGRGIEVDVPGRGKQRGRIASIELRQGSLDTPTLVFGILLDEKREEVVASSRAALRAGDSPLAREVEYQDEHADEAPGPELGVAARSELVEGRAQSSAPPAHAGEKRRADEPRVVKIRAAERATSAADAYEEDDEVARALKSRTPEGLALVFKALALTLAWLRNTLLPALLTGARKLLALFSEGEGEGEGESEREPGPSRLLISLARVRAALLRAWKSLQKRRTTAPVPRMQRSPATARPQQRSEPAAPPRKRRWLTVSLAAIGVGLGVYALAPRSGADRIRVRSAEPSLLHAPAPEHTVTALPEGVPLVSSASPAPVVAALEARGAPHDQGQLANAAAAVQSAGAHNVEPSEPASLSPRFGESSVPNGRIFVLRMSGPVKSLEGDAREDGFSVRIPGRLALDRASPIATSHRAVARALILNRGEYAELTVEFLPGMRPKYQVTAKDSNIEVTLERL